jgi:hypothetical protein
MNVFSISRVFVNRSIVLSINVIRIM